jgi:hypothetical protein
MAQTYAQIIYCGVPCCLTSPRPLPAQVRRLGERHSRAHGLQGEHNT